MGRGEAKVVEFSADTTAWVLDAIRARYRIGRQQGRADSAPRSEPMPNNKTSGR